MAKPNPAARESLLEAAQHLMLAQGFAATTVDHICQAAAVTKGAFFHYFKSKDELAKATFDRFCRRGGERYQRAPFLKERDPLERLNGYVDFTIAQVKHPLRDSCLVGMFSQELADSHPMLRTMCDDASRILDPREGPERRRTGPGAARSLQALCEHALQGGNEMSGDRRRFTLAFFAASSSGC